MTNLIARIKNYIEHDLENRRIASLVQQFKEAIIEKEGVYSQYSLVMALAKGKGDPNKPVFKKDGSLNLTEFELANVIELYKKTPYEKSRF